MVVLSTRISRLSYTSYEIKSHQFLRRPTLSFTDAKSTILAAGLDCVLDRMSVFVAVCPRETVATA